MNSIKNNQKSLILTLILPVVLVLAGCSSKVLDEGKAQRLVDKFTSSHSGTAKIAGGVVQNEGASIAEAKLDFTNFADSQYGSYSGPGVASFSKYNDDTWALTRVTISPPDNFMSTRWYDTGIKE
ncbi:hypothetical protein [Nostoc sp.]|uniref:hypothetical protein n=1 Tax=Nostoc sp. TaxID=1180 RepID=UPI002FF106CF